MEAAAWWFLNSKEQPEEEVLGYWIARRRDLLGFSGARGMLEVSQVI